MSYVPFGEGYAGGQGYVQFTGINSWTVADTENQSGSLEDFMFRRYSPVQGRWISPDPAGLGAVDPSNPQSWNRYAYVGNTPLSATDPLGLFSDMNDAVQYNRQMARTEGALTAYEFFGLQLYDIWGYSNDKGGSIQAVPVSYPTESLDEGHPNSDGWQMLGIGYTGGDPIGPGTAQVTNPPPANNRRLPKKTGCGLAVAQGTLSVGLDIVGAIPGLGNAVSATAAGARAVNGIVAYGGAAYGIGTGLTDESPFGAASAGAGLGFTLADAALEGGKVIPVLGNALSATIGLYDGYQLAKTIQRCW